MSTTSRKRASAIAFGRDVKGYVEKRRADELRPDTLIKPPGHKRWFVVTATRVVPDPGEVAAQVDALDSVANMAERSGYAIPTAYRDVQSQTRSTLLGRRLLAGKVHVSASHGAGSNHDAYYNPSDPLDVLVET